MWDSTIKAGNDFKIMFEMLSVGELYDQGKCIKTGCRHFKPVSGWIKLFSRNGQGPLLLS